MEKGGKEGYRLPQLQGLNFEPRESFVMNSNAITKKGAIPSWKLLFNELQNILRVSKNTFLPQRE